jgi:hypothetical protein
MEGEQEVVQPVEEVVEGNDNQEQTIQTNPHEDQAKSLGWRPKEEFEGNPEDWRSAKDFIERGEMIGRIRSQSQKIQNIEQALKHVTTQNANVYANGYKQAIADLKVQRRQALEDGNVVLADDISERIDATRAEAVKAVAGAVAPVRQLDSGPDPEHHMWVQSNPWYDNIPTMRRFADSAAIEFVQANAGKVTPDQVRRYIGDLVRSEFPHRFVKGNQAAPNPDGEGRSNRGAVTGDQRLSKIESSMTEEQRTIMKTIMRSAGMTKAEYLKQYSE